MNESSNQLNIIHKKIDSLYKRLLRQKSIEGLFVSIGIVFVINLVFSLFENVGFNSRSERTILFFSGIIISAIVFLLFVVIPFFISLYHVNKKQRIKTAKLIGRNFEDIKDELQNVIELEEEEQKYLYSTDLIYANIKAAFNKVQSKNLFNIIDYTKFKLIIKITAFFIALNILLFLLFPQLGWASYRIINFEKEFSVSPKIMFEITPGDSVITKGNDIKIRAAVYGDSPEMILFYLKGIDDASYLTRKIFRNAAGDFEIKLEKIRNSFRYKIKVADLISRDYKIKVIDRPIISNIKIIVTPPAYSNLAEAEQIDNGNIAALKGSKIYFQIKSSKELAKARLIFDDSSSIKLKTEGINAFCNFNAKIDRSYKIIIEDKSGIKNVNAILYHIKIIEDEFPTIDLIMPEKDFALTSNNIVKIISQIKDDYGFSKLVLKYKLLTSKFENEWNYYKEIIIPVSDKIKEDEVLYNWDFSELNPAIEDAYSFYLEIFDNDKVSGPKSAKSKQITVRVPSADELYKQLDKNQDEIKKNLEETLKETEKLNKELQKTSNELKQDKKELTWNEKEKIQKSIEKFEELQNKVENTKKQLSEMKKDIEENKLLSMETLQKYLELQKLMDEMTSEELKNVFKKLEEALKTLNRNDIQKTLEEMKFDEESFQKSLDRTLNLLKRIQIEQKIDELIKRAENIMKELNELEKLTEDKKNNLDELTKRQKELTKQLEQFDEEIKKLSKKMSEFSDLPNDEMKKLNEEIENQNNEEKSADAEDALKDNDRAEANKLQKMMLANMKQSMMKMQNLQSKMQMQNQLSTMMGMMKALEGLISLSKEQEALRLKTRDESASKKNENTKSQNRLKNNLDKVINQLSDLSQKTFAITPEMGRALGNAKMNMLNAIQNLQSKNVSSTLQSQRQAMKYLNESAALLKSGMEQMMQGGEQGGGMMSMMQQMQKLSQQQMQLNQLTQQLNNKQLTEGQLGELRRLAQQQEMIRKSIEELNREAKESGESKKLAANLENIIKEMKEVVEGLKSEKINDEIVKSQDKILSRMLDAQRSINERDFEKQRESESGKTLSRKSPENNIQIDKKTRIQEELQKAIREGYKKDYEKLIRRYFESLENAK